MAALAAEQSDACLICFSDLGTNMRAKLPCGHDDMCGVCHLRLRHLHEDKKCPICKTTNDTIIVDKDDSKTFEDYPRWGDEIGAGFVYKQDVGMFFEEDYYKQAIVPLYEFSCNKCDFTVDDSVFVNQHLNKDENEKGTKKKKKPRRLLLDHLRNKHRLGICQLCIDHKRDFISQLPRFTPSQLQNHLKKGDGPGSGFNGHPICEFCRPKRFYDVNYLYQHLHKEHYKCHICEKQGKDNQWFKHYGSLARHFEKQHFLCNHPQCLEARFVVFENELDLKAHEIAVHGGTSSGSTKINLEFNIRRANNGGPRQNAPSEADFNYDLDGQAFVPPALVQENNNDEVNTPNNESLLHPQHVQRTEELRAQAAMVREQHAMNSQEESFPTLQASAGPTSSSAPLVGWASGTALAQNINRSNRNIGEVNQEAFPTLPTNNNQNKKKKASIRGNIGATRRQFAAMTTSANTPQQQAATWGASSSAGLAATPARQLNRQADLSRDNFPSLGGGLSTESAVARNRQADLSRDNFPSLSGSSSSSAASSVARQGYSRRAAPPPSMSSATDFPSMGNRVSTSSSVARVAQQKKKAPPSVNSATDFPAPPSAKPAKASLRQQMFEDRKSPPENNFPHADMVLAASAKTTIEDMKASLGQKNFKQLKKLTKAFAQGELSPEGYVDQAASLFDRGYEDPDFWSYLPSLLQSCPNQRGAQHAQNYMSSLKHQVEQPMNKKKPAKGAASSSKWGGASSNSNVMRQVAPPPTTSYASAPRSATASYAAPPRSLTQPTALRPAQTISSGKKSAWGAGGKTTVVRTKAPPGSVAAAAAMQGPQGGSATKFMAKQQKKEKQAKNNGSNNSNQPQKAKKKKQKNELRDLAFGK
mmetsp:Transcript_14500/g.36421  ORF Transcript_14500/g.36421 Transcript_14500/m.36421 type:complete len:872 (-) Transcript_14500:54-2669(-)